MLHVKEALYRSVSWFGLPRTMAEFSFRRVLFHFVSRGGKGRASDNQASRIIVILLNE